MLGQAQTGSRDWSRTHLPLRIIRRWILIVIYPHAGNEKLLVSYTNRQVLITHCQQQIGKLNRFLGK